MAHFKKNQFDHVGDQHDVRCEYWRPKQCDQKSEYKVSQIIPKVAQT